MLEPMVKTVARTWYRAGGCGGDVIAFDVWLLEKQLLNTYDKVNLFAL